MLTLKEIEELFNSDTKKAKAIKSNVHVLLNELSAQIDRYSLYCDIDTDLDPQVKAFRDRIVNDVTLLMSAISHGSDDLAIHFENQEIIKSASILGSIKSKAKAKSSAENGKLGGRPKATASSIINK